MQAHTVRFDMEMLHVSVQMMGLRSPPYRKARKRLL